MARALERSLTALGYDVTPVRSVAAACELAEHFAIAVLDVDLPDGSGVELARRLVDRGQARQLVFFSATSDAEVVEDAKRVGPFVSKLDGLAGLKDAIAKHAPGVPKRRVAMQMPAVRSIGSSKK